MSVPCLLVGIDDMSDQKKSRTFQTFGSSQIATIQSYDSESEDVGGVCFLYKAIWGGVAK